MLTFETTTDIDVDATLDRLGAKLLTAEFLVAELLAYDLGNDAA